MATFPGNPAADPLTGAEIVPLTQGGVDKRTTVQDIANMADASEIAFSDTGFTATNVHDAIVEAASGGGGGSAAWGDITGTLSDQSDLQSALDSKASNSYTIVTEAGAFTANPGDHDGITRYNRCGGDVTFDNAEPYTAGMVFNIRATAAISLIGDGVTLTPPAGGTLDLDTAMSVQVVMTSSTAGDVIGQTVAAS